MRIWQVTENDKQIRFYWFATKQEAEQHCRAYERPEGWDTGDCEVTAIDMEVSRKGLAEAMNYVISLTCFNEG